MEVNDFKVLFVNIGFFFILIFDDGCEKGIVFFFLKNSVIFVECEI